ncbi:MAG: radical SAM family heme chaperone HemW [Roseiflexaceae bacterium]|nr:radical SAM family heme chaperone HemW [Roseiflexaceae bacterium]
MIANHIPLLSPLSPLSPSRAIPDWRAAHQRPRHLYLHIPFCHRRCAYCDFNTYANMDDRMEAYVDALCAELAALQAMPLAIGSHIAGGPGLLRGDILPTVFLGGGTPSMLPLPLIERVLRAADALIPLAGAEVTIEANPGTVLGREYLRDLRSLGINRISMGVQSLHDPTLRVLGRIHTAAEARSSYEDARAVGFDSINLDFIFGLPGQTQEQWRATLDEIVTWQADHFSLYSLILEASTPLYAQVTSGRISIPDDDEAGAMYERAIDQLGAAGYVQYEISNWARDTQRPQHPASGSQLRYKAPTLPTHACHHNVAYWLNVDYLACGAGAHGHLYPRRYADALGIDDYIRRVSLGEVISEVTELSPHDMAAETMFMGLRLTAGVAEAHFRERCGSALDDIYGVELAELATQGLIERDAIGVRLTERGRMLGNRVFERFV